MEVVTGWGKMHSLQYISDIHDMTLQCVENGVKPQSVKYGPILNYIGVIFVNLLSL